MHGSSRFAAWTIGFLALACLPLALAADPTEPGWVAVFNGKDLSTWSLKKTTIWRVEDGVMIGETEENTGATRIRTRPLAVQDAVIEFDARFTGDVDAQICSRKGGLCLWLGSAGKDPENRTGSWHSGKEFIEAGRAKNVEKLWKKNDWNTIRFMAKGDTFTAWINGEQVSEIVDSSYWHKNHIDLVTHAGKKMKIEFRNFRAKDL